jgi:WD40 repeat protein
VWHFKVKGKARKIDKEKMIILRGHDDEITCIQLSVDLDVCISGSRDGTIVIHTLIGGNYVRTVEYPAGFVVHKLALSHQGHFVAYSHGDRNLHKFGILPLKQY